MILTVANAEKMAQYDGNLLGVTTTRTIPKQYKIDDNYVNRIVLGFNLPVQRKYTLHDLKHCDKLYDFQKEDVLRMINSPFFLNANKMGYGKTIETIAALLELDSRSILIVCPKPVIGQWVAQIKEWWGRDAHVYNLKEQTVRGEIYVTNYEKLLSPKSDGQFNRFVWDALVLDEAHYIKNRNAKRTKKCKEIPASRRYALTGTPILRNPEDLWSILHFLSPQICGRSFWNFVNYFCQVSQGMYGREIKGLTEDEAHVEVLHKLFDAVACRHNDIKIAVGKQQVQVPIIMDSKQTNLYEKLRKLVLDELPQELTIPNGAVLLTRLIQATSCPAVLPDNEGNFGAKFEWILETAKNNPDEKFVVFSKFEKVVAMLEKYLTENDIGCTTYTGKIPHAVRNEHKRKFIEDASCQLMLGTIGALGTGVDGMQDVCNLCIFIDRDPLPELNAQCEDRLNRMGQQKFVTCYYLECRKTIDKKVGRDNFKRAEDIRRALNEVEDEN